MTKCRQCDGYLVMRVEADKVVSFCDTCNPRPLPKAWPSQDRRKREQELRVPGPPNARRNGKA